MLSLYLAIICLTVRIGLNIVPSVVINMGGKFMLLKHGADSGQICANYAEQRNVPSVILSN